jgi:hypothetical protein
VTQPVWSRLLLMAALACVGGGCAPSSPSSSVPPSPPSDAVEDPLRVAREFGGQAPKLPSIPQPLRGKVTELPFELRRNVEQLLGEGRIADRTLEVLARALALLPDDAGPIPTDSLARFYADLGASHEPTGRAQSAAILGLFLRESERISPSSPCSIARAISQREALLSAPRRFAVGLSRSVACIGIVEMATPALKSLDRAIPSLYSTGQLPTIPLSDAGMREFERYVDAIVAIEVAKAVAMCQGADCDEVAVARAIARGLARVTGQCASAHGHFITAEAFGGRGVPCMIFGWSISGSNFDISVSPSTQLLTE